jgi:arsenical pump membrane protein
LAIAVAAIAVVLLALRPPRVAGWVWPTAGAALVIATGNEPLWAAVRAVAGQWNVLLFILGLMGISVAADESGAFQSIADFVLQIARGSRRRLFVLLFVACALVTLLLSNDATAIALTPIVYRAVSRRAGGDVKPYLFACVFTANAASFGLPFSNPANVLILPHPRLGAYLWHMVPAQLAVIAVTLTVFLFFFSRRLAGRFEIRDSDRVSPRAIRTLYALGAIIAAYVVALLVHSPLGPVALAGAVLTSLIAGAAPLHVVRRISWKTLVILGGLFVLLDAVARGGFLGWTLVEVDRALRYGTLATTAITVAGAGLFSNLFNNLPVAVAASYVVSHISVERIAYPFIVGVDVGPNLITTGSLATILWLSAVRSYGVRVTLGEYFGLGALVVPPAIAVSVLWLWIAR